MRRPGLVAMVGLAGAAVSACSGHRPAPAEVSTCLADARRVAAAAAGTPQQRRLRLEAAAGRCFAAPADDARQTIQARFGAAYAELAAALVSDQLRLADWRALRTGLGRKEAVFARDAAARTALLAGDEDGDFVPDRTDRCRGTPPRTVTDGDGCPVARDISVDDQRQEAAFRAALGASRTLVSPACDGLPAPAAPAPIAWGRGLQPVLGTQGFNIAVTRVAPQRGGCEIFYQVQLQFREPNAGNPALPPTRLQTIMFSAAEDQNPNGEAVHLPLPVTGAPLSPGRAVVTTAFFREYGQARWRVRAVNGANRASAWSPFVTQGPAPGGVGF